MLIVDVRKDIIHTYTCKLDAVQKATAHLSRSEYKKSFLGKKNLKTIVLLDESSFLRYHIQVQISQQEPLTWSQYKALITQKVHKVQAELWVKKEMIKFVIKNTKVNREPADYMIWESGMITFDIGFYVFDQGYSDLIHLDHVVVYPRRFFLLHHQMLTQKSQWALLVIEPHHTSLVHIQNGRYTKMHGLNGGDDLLRQAYEQAWLDPLTTSKKDFSENTLWEKLLIEAHTEFTNLILSRVQTHLESWVDLYLVSRLIQQPYFVDQLSKGYIEKFHGRLVPYRGSELSNICGRQRWNDELPVVLALQAAMKTK